MRRQSVVTSLDYRDVLVSTRESDVVYMDPPIKECAEIETHDTSQAFRLMILLTHLTGFIRGGFAI